ncbi:hypothetical protein [Streptomyces sp. KAU_LT]|uniref:hypothetical protein n=1 Tax=Streptomyces sp. KAU_LT TaxID=3046669 RepID=UPI0024B77836|nr:hypothetical protein [Streptomyces sp. KAU_LT]MDI9830814.1 hypothetical protein [Streptomyces sp. KAU_LT]
MAEILLRRSYIEIEEGPLIVVGDADSAHHAIRYLPSGTAGGIDEHGTGRRTGELLEQPAFPSARRAVQVHKAVRRLQVVQSRAELIDCFLRAEWSMQGDLVLSLGTAARPRVTVAVGQKG